MQMFKEILTALGILPGPYAGMSVKDAARAVYLDEERARDPQFSDQATIHDSKYNPGTLKPDGTTAGVVGSQFDYLWNFYQGYQRSNPSMAKMTIMAGWERKARAGGAH